MAQQIVRNGASKSSIFFQWPVRAESGAELVCDVDEVAAFVFDGRVLGVLGPGRHLLHPGYVPFLAATANVDGAIGAELVFVTTRPIAGVRAGGGTGPIFDRLSGASVIPRFAGELVVRIADPVRALQATMTPGQTHEHAFGTLVQYALAGAFQALATRAGQETGLGRILLHPESQRRFAGRVLHMAQSRLAEAGIEIGASASLEAILSEDDAAKLRSSDGAPPAPAEPVYEMLWDCRYCGTKKLLGLTHRHCPSCGAPQNADERYFPPDAEKVPVQNHVYYGADVTCPHCGEANSKNSKHCGGCGGPLDGAKEVARRGDRLHATADTFAGQTAADVRREKAVTAGPPKPAKASPSKWIAGIGCVSVVVLLALVLAVVFWKRDSALEVVGHRWQRQILVERFGPVEQTGWCDAIPGDARLIRRHREVRSHHPVPDGKDCQIRKVDNGNGTFSEKQECSTRYRDEPVYDQKCYYVVTRWKLVRTAKAEGSSSDPLRWPDAELARTGSCEGCEREDGRKEAYTVLFRDEEGGEQSCDFDLQKWTSVRDGSKWKGALRVVGSSLDCGSLRPQ